MSPIRSPIRFPLAVWGLAFYGATRLYYPFGGAGRACAFSGLMAGAALSAAALVSRSPGIARNRWFFFAAGLLWAVGGALLGTGVDLNLDHPLKRPPPGRFFLLAGVVVWHLPFALLRSAQRRCLR